MLLLCYDTEYIFWNVFWLEYVDFQNDEFNLEASYKQHTFRK